MNRTLFLLLIPLLIITSASLAFATIPIEDNSMIALACGKAILVFTRTPTYTSNDPGVSCRFTGVKSGGYYHLEITLRNLAPGDRVLATTYIENIGSEPMKLHEVASHWIPFSPLTYKDDLPASIKAHSGPIPLHITITLPAGTGNSYQGKSATMIIIITGWTDR